MNKVKINGKLPPHIKNIIDKNYMTTVNADSFSDQYLFEDNGILSMMTKTMVERKEKPLFIDLEKLLQKNCGDNEVVGGLFSKACYIDDSWPSLLYLAYKYVDAPKQALLANTNLGGENCHRGSVLGVLIGLATGDGLKELFSHLANATQIEDELNALIEST